MANVGYYQSTTQTGNANQLDEIVELGQTGVNITALTRTALQPLRVLLVQNPSNDEYQAPLLAAWPDVLAAVNNGLVVVIHDRFVTDAADLMPAGTNIAFTREYSAAMQLGADGAEIASTPYGTVSDTSLDNGTFSNHGYALLSSLPAGSQVLMTTDDPTHVTAFVVFHGAGAIVYTSVPLDFSGYNNSNPGSDNVWEDFGVNILAHALTLGQDQPSLNTAPVAVDDEVTVNEGAVTTINVLGNDTDAEGNPLRITHINGVAVTAGQTVTLAGGSTVRLTAAGTLVYQTARHDEPAEPWPKRSGNLHLHHRGCRQRRADRRGQRDGQRQRPLYRDRRHAQRGHPDGHCVRRRDERQGRQ